MSRWALLVVIAGLLVSACGPVEDNAALNPGGAESRSKTAPRGGTAVATGIGVAATVTPSPTREATAAPTLDLGPCPEAGVSDGKVIEGSCEELQTPEPYDPSLDEGYLGTGEEVCPSDGSIPKGKEELCDVSALLTPQPGPPCKPGAQPTSRYPGVEGCVTDPSGRPIHSAYVAPMIMIPEVPNPGIALPPTNAGGYYSRSLSRPGPYEITVTAERYKTVTKQVTITDKPLVLDFVLEPVEK